jgi:hypothetical protein
MVKLVVGKQGPGGGAGGARAAMGRFCGDCAGQGSQD